MHKSHSSWAAVFHRRGGLFHLGLRCPSESGALTKSCEGGLLSAPRHRQQTLDKLFFSLHLTPIFIKTKSGTRPLLKGRTAFGFHQVQDGGDGYKQLTFARKLLSRYKHSPYLEGIC